MFATQKSSSEESEKGGAGNAAFVKVSMDGAPYLRKVDLRMYKTYLELSDALAKMFSSFTIGTYYVTRFTSRASFPFLFFCFILFLFNVMIFIDIMKCVLSEGNCGSQGVKDFMNESKLMDLLNGSDYVPTYEDKDGDWMLVGDVPWE